MLDETTTRGRIVAAAMRLAAKKGWRRLGLDEIAAEAGVDLADLRADFAGKTAILEAFSAEVDRALLRKVRPNPQDGIRDRLFDIVMTRLEVLAPHKEALKRIAADMRRDPLLALGLCGPSLRAKYWMLTAAGVRPDSRAGCLRMPQLAAAVACAVPVWLDDDDPGMARTMATLDRQLRRGERVVDLAEEACAVADRLVRTFGRRRRTDDTAEARAPSDQQAPPPGAQPSAEPPLA